jgi:hypothetical protein
MLDGYENPDPTTPAPALKKIKPLVRPIPVISQRILNHVDSLERVGETARHSAFVVIPKSGIWRKIGNKTFYRLFSLRYLQHSRKNNGIQEAINKAKSRVFIKDASYTATTALTLQPGIALEGESMPQLTNVDPTPPENITFTTNANGDTGTVLTTTGNNDCFTGNLLRTISISNLGLSNFTNGFNIGKANTLGITKSTLRRILFSSVATPLNVQNFQNLNLDQIYAWLPTTNFILAQNNNVNWNGGNSYWTDLFAHGCKNVNGAVSLLAVAGYLNMIECHRLQVNMADSGFVGSTTGYGLYLQGQQNSAFCQNNEFYALDIEGTPLDPVRLEDNSHYNYVHLAYSLRQVSGFDFSLKKNATTTAPRQNFLIFHSNPGASQCKVESDDFNNFLETSLPLLPVTGSYPAGISGVGMASFNTVNFTTMFGGGSGQAMVGHTTSNSTVAQTAAVNLATDQMPVAQQVEVGASLFITAYTSGTIQIQTTFTDPQNNAQTITMPLLVGSTGSYATGAAAAGWFSTGPLTISSKANTTITVKTVGTFTATYNGGAIIRASG